MHPLRELLADDPGFLVPAVIPELSTQRILTTQLIHGLPLDQCADLPQEVKNNVSAELFQLPKLYMYVEGTYVRVHVVHTELSNYQCWAKNTSSSFYWDIIHVHVSYNCTSYTCTCICTRCWEGQFAGVQ